MTDDSLFQQITSLLEALKAGDGRAIRQLVSLAEDHIREEGRSSSTSVAIASTIRIAVTQHTFPNVVVARLLQLADSLEQHAARNWRGRRTIRIFVSSPGDVMDERGLVQTAVRKIQNDPLYKEVIYLAIVDWTDPTQSTPMLATKNPQQALSEGLARPSECDITVVIMWSRMGLPLPLTDEFTKPEAYRFSNNSGLPLAQYYSGTEWEYIDAVLGAARSKQVTGVERPLVAVYRRMEEPKLYDRAREKREQIQRQYELLDDFFASFTNPDGSIRKGYNRYKTPDEFEAIIEQHLRRLIARCIEQPMRAPGGQPQFPVPVWPADRSPFPGLRAYTPQDAPIFFGRGKEIAELIQRLNAADCRLLAVVGASGSGKSSLVGAGLIPRLAENAVEGSKDWLLPSYDEGLAGWTGLRVTPGGEVGDDPFNPLARQMARLVTASAREIAGRLSADPQSITTYLDEALAGRPEWAKALLFVDQFEELFTVVRQEKREDYTRMLVAVTEYDRACTVITMRADFADRCAELPSLNDLMQASDRSTFWLSRPKWEALYDMIKRPAQVTGLRFEEGLDWRILEDTGDEPGALALVAYTLEQLWRRRNAEGVLTWAAYNSLGVDGGSGVEGAIGAQASRAYATLSQEAKDALPVVFRRLVEVSEGGKPTRRRALLRKVTGHPAEQELVAALIKARLLVTGRTEGGEATIEVAHEALFHAWGELKSWIDDTGEDLALGGELLGDAQRWDRNGRERSSLLREAQLIRAEEWLNRGENRELAGDLLRDFIQASLDEQARVELEREQQRRRLLRIMAGATIVALVLATVAGFFMIHSRRNAQELIDLATVDQANQVLRGHNPDLALALALHATGGEDPPQQAYAALLDAAYRSLSRDLYSVCGQDDGAWVTALDLSPDNGKAAVGCSTGESSEITILDLQTGSVEREWAYPAWLLSLAYSPDGQTILAGYSNAQAVLWEPDGSSRLVLSGHEDAVSAVDFDPEGASAATVSYDKTANVWDLRTGEILYHLSYSRGFLSPGRFTSLDYSPDGERIVLGDDLGAVYVWRPEEWAVDISALRDRHTDFVLDVEFGPDGSQIVSSAADSTISIWEFGDRLSRVDTLNISEQHPGVWVNSAEFLPDGTQMLTTLSDGAVLLWDVRSRQLIQSLEGHLSEVQSIAVSSDGSFALSGARDGSIRLWDLGAFRAISTVGVPNAPLPNAEINSLVFTRDGSLMLGGAANGTLSLWNTATRRMLLDWEAYPSHVSISAIALTPDESHLLTAGSDGRAILWDMSTRRLIWQVANDGDNLRAVDISPDGSTGILGYASGVIFVVDLETGQRLCTLNGHTNSVNAVRFSPDGRFAISGANDHSVIRWDLSTCGSATTLFQHDSWVMALAFSPTDNLLASASADGTIILWDLDSERQIHRLSLPEMGVNPGLDSYVLSLDFSPDGRLLSAGSANGSLAIWSVENGILLRNWVTYPEESCEYNVHCFWVLNTRFSPSGDEVWSSSADGVIRIWQPIQASGTAGLRDWLTKNRYIYELTAQEEAAYGISD
jgi:WD40 repeat protein